jgi:hypothetical protein
MTNQLCLQQQHWGQLYKKMLRQLAGYNTGVTDEKKWIEWGFGITTRNWLNIQQVVDNYLFENQQEEINFYKVLKPGFVGLIDYFTLLYKSVLFQPEDAQGKKDYWNGELANCKNFLSKHQSFCRYYEGGHTGLDHIYFIQQNNKEPLILGANETSWNRAGAVIISYSYLLSRLISIKKYQRYVQQKIRLSYNCN